MSPVPAEQSAIVPVQDGFLYREDESGDGGPPVRGSQGIYRISGGDTLTISERTCIGTYRFDVSGQTLRLRVLKQCNDPDAPYNTTLLTTSALHAASG